MHYASFLKKKKLKIFYTSLLLWNCCVRVVQIRYLIKIYMYKENVRFTTPIQQLYNNLSHEGGAHILGPTLM
jgi:pterin-4a-carbinolamine dehydratase